MYSGKHFVQYKYSTQKRLNLMNFSHAHLHNNEGFLPAMQKRLSPFAKDGGDSTQSCKF